MDTEVAEPFDFMGRCAREILRIVHIDREKVVIALKSLNPNKTPGPDGLYPKVLMEVAEQIGDPVLRIYGHSLQYSVVPEYWEVANITSTFKGGTKATSVTIDQ